MIIILPLALQIRSIWIEFTDFDMKFVIPNALKIYIPLLLREVRDGQEITVEFINRIYLLKGWGVKANLLRIGKLQTEKFFIG